MSTFRYSPLLQLCYSAYPGVAIGWESTAAPHADGLDVQERATAMTLLESAGMSSLPTSLCAACCTPPLKALLGERFGAARCYPSKRLRNQSFGCVHRPFRGAASSDASQEQEEQPVFPTPMLQQLLAVLLLLQQAAAAPQQPGVNDWLLRTAGPLQQLLPVAPSFSGAAAAADYTAVAISATGAVSGLHLATGKLLWRLLLGENWLLLQQQQVDHLLVLLADVRHPLESAHAANPAASNPAVETPAAAVSTRRRGTLHVIDLQEGVLLWKAGHDVSSFALASSGSAVSAGAARHGRTAQAFVVATETPRGLEARDASSGSVLWAKGAYFLHFSASGSVDATEALEVEALSLLPLGKCTSLAGTAVVGYEEGTGFTQKRIQSAEGSSLKGGSFAQALQSGEWILAPLREDGSEKQNQRAVAVRLFGEVVEAKLLDLRAGTEKPFLKEALPAALTATVGSVGSVLGGGPTVAAALAFAADAQQHEQLLLLLSDFSVLNLQKGQGVSWVREEGLSLITNAVMGALPIQQEACE
ncbi:hypothetical protein cyc_05002 [Cyclospora cayetanensis]|uniref:ER membrane protein complex subunit 1 n=1 Tax=Cyclospora cayetanensis TaxID=88456 RepID=A0A1D3D148_9EIME|nr:hypothetical protein cyc_05002 [Cyclospora cayetanensis]